MKRIIPLLLLFFISIQVYSQDTPWAIQGINSLLFNQTSFNNWAAGGEDALTFTALSSWNAVRETETTKWDNILNLGYGIQKTELPHFSTRKNQDLIDASSTFGYRMTPTLNATGLLGFKSQFAAGYKYEDSTRVLVSNFMAPGYVLISLGFEQKIMEGVSAYLSPATGKVTIVRDEGLSNAGAYGVDSGKTVRGQFGAYFTLKVNREIVKNVIFKSKLDLFADYATIQAIDMDLLASLNFQVNDYISAILSVQMIYDEDILIPDESSGALAPRTQYKQVFGLGLTYKITK